MKKCKLLSVVAVMILCFTVESAVGQIRHVKGIKAVEGNYLKTQQGSGFLFGYSEYLGRKFYYKGSLGVEKGTISELEFTSFIFGAEGLYTFLNIKQFVFINAVLGVNVMYDSFANDAFSDTKGFQFALQPGIEVEYFFSDTFGLIGGFRQLYDLSENFGRSRYYVTIGLKYSF